MQAGSQRALQVWCTLPFAQQFPHPAGQSSGRGWRRDRHRGPGCSPRFELQLHTNPFEKDDSSPELLGIPRPRGLPDASAVRPAPRSVGLVDGGRGVGSLALPVVQFRLRRKRAKNGRGGRWIRRASLACMDLVKRPTVPIYEVSATCTTGAEMCRRSRLKRALCNVIQHPSGPKRRPSCVVVLDELGEHALKMALISD
jgi:hypothetical protein